MIFKNRYAKAGRLLTKSKINLLSSLVKIIKLNSLCTHPEDS